MANFHAVALMNDAVLYLAAEDPKGPEFGKASPLGLVIIVLLLAGTAMLIRSMNSQLKKLPKDFDAEHPEADQAFDEGTDSSGASASGGAEDVSEGDTVDGSQERNGSGGAASANRSSGT